MENDKEMDFSQACTSEKKFWLRPRSHVRWISRQRNVRGKGKFIEGNVCSDL